MYGAAEWPDCPRLSNACGQADGCTVETIEASPKVVKLLIFRNAFVTRNAAQCGFCTPGMLLTAAELLAADPGASRGGNPETYFRQH